MIQRRHSGCDLAGALASVLTSQGRMFRDEAWAGVIPVALLKVKLGQGAQSPASSVPKPAILEALTTKNGDAGVR